MFVGGIGVFGVGITPNGTGFDGTMGDPLYQVNQAPGQFIPGYPVTNHPSISDAGALADAPSYPPPPPPILVTGQANFIPELGMSMTSAQKKYMERLAVQIVSMMEASW